MPDTELAALARDRLDALSSILDRLLAGEPLPFDAQLRSRLPDRPGVYVIYEADGSPLAPLHAGRTRAGGLRQRVYQNHFMGSQAGNLRAKLVRGGMCTDSEAAKDWMRRHCLVKFAVVDDVAVVPWAEHLALAALQPRFSD